MKRFLFLICAFLTAQNGIAQKNDYIWLLGYNDHFNDTVMGTKIDFNYDPPRISNHRRNLNFLDPANSSVCDDQGALQFYTNGVSVMNNADQLMQNGYPLLECDSAYGCYSPQTVLSLPFPGFPNKYALLAEQYFTKTIQGPRYDSVTYIYAFSGLTYNIIDMSANSGRGAITTRHDTLIRDTLTGHLTATRHANGRDWWIVEPRNANNTYYRVLLSPKGLQTMGSQALGTNSSDYGHSIFSPDGETYIRFGGSEDIIYNDKLNQEYLQIFHFDRCSGLLSGAKSLIVNYFGYQFPQGLAVSPNSRFLYVSLPDTLLQYDLRSQDIASSRAAVAVYDGFRTVQNFPSRFLLSHLAPDGKIYIATNTNTMHVITQPDSAGPACKVLQRSVLLPTYNSVVPNYPFFRLGALRGSPCDTLTPTADASEKRDVKLYPNPDFVGAAVTLELSAPLRSAGRLLIYDRLGRLAYSAPLSAGMDVFHPDAAGLAAGMYICVLWEGQERVWTGKLAVLEE